MSAGSLLGALLGGLALAGLWLALWLGVWRRAGRFERRRWIALLGPERMRTRYRDLLDAALNALDARLSRRFDQSETYHVDGAKTEAARAWTPDLLDRCLLLAAAVTGLEALWRGGAGAGPAALLVAAGLAAAHVLGCAGAFAAGATVALSAFGDWPVAAAASALGGAAAQGWIGARAGRRGAVLLLYCAALLAVAAFHAQGLAAATVLAGLATAGTAGFARWRLRVGYLRDPVANALAADLIAAAAYAALIAALPAAAVLKLPLLPLVLQGALTLFVLGTLVPGRLGDAVVVGLARGDGGAARLWLALLSAVSLWLPLMLLAVL